MFRRLLALGPILLAGCSGPEPSVYRIPDDPESGIMRVTEPGGGTMTTDEEVYRMPRPTFQVIDLTRGTGAEATSYRRYTLGVTMTPAGGTPPASAEISFIYPTPEHPENPGANTWMTFGHVPDRFLAGIAGMRVGGRRRFALPAAEHATIFHDGRTRRSVFHQLPGAVDWTCEVSLLAVCKPYIVVRSDYLSAVGEVRRPLALASCD